MSEHTTGHTRDLYTPTIRNEAPERDRDWLLTQVLLLCDEVDGLRETVEFRGRIARKAMGWRSEAEARERDERRIAHDAIQMLREAYDTIVWMSGSTDFSPEGQAGEEWARRRDGIVAEIGSALSGVAKATGEVAS